MKVKPLAKSFSICTFFASLTFSGFSLALSAPAPPPQCPIANPCASLDKNQGLACAEKNADWIIEGIFTDSNGLVMVDKVSVVRGSPLVRDYRDGIFYLWVSCWRKRSLHATPIKAYGISGYGVFFVTPEANWPMPVGWPLTEPVGK